MLDIWQPVQQSIFGKSGLIEFVDKIKHEIELISYDRKLYKADFNFVSIF